MAICEIDLSVEVQYQIDIDIGYPCISGVGTYERITIPSVAGQLVYNDNRLTGRTILLVFVDNTRVISSEFTHSGNTLTIIDDPQNIRDNQEIFIVLI